MTTILSINVGIEDLGLCYMTVDSHTEYTIDRWGTMDLTIGGKYDRKCKTSNCLNIVKYHIPESNKYFCHSCAKQSEYKIPRENQLKEFVAKISRKKLQNMFCYPHDTNKKLILSEYNKRFNEQMYLDPIKEGSQKLLDYNKNFIEKIKWFLSGYKYPDIVLIDNQVSNNCVRMKSIQSCISTFFIICDCQYIIHCNARDKLKGYLPVGVVNAPELNKYLITVAVTKLLELEDSDGYLYILNNHSKKHSIASCYLQAMYFIKHKLDNVLKDTKYFNFE